MNKKNVINLIFLITFFLCVAILSNMAPPQYQGNDENPFTWFPSTSKNKKIEKREIVFKCPKCYGKGTINNHFEECKKNKTGFACQKYGCPSIVKCNKCGGKGTQKHIISK